MRRAFPLVLLLPLGLGCGKKPAPAPTSEAKPTAPTSEAKPSSPAASVSDRDKLLTALKTKHGDARQSAADALAALADSDPSVLDGVIELLKEKANAGAGQTHPTQIRSTRGAAVTVLLHSGPKGEAALREKGFPLLREGLSDPNPAVREHTAHAIGLIGPPAQPLARSLQKLCTDPDPTVRGVAFDALRSVGVADVAELATLLTHKEADIRRYAAEIIATLPEVPSTAVPALTRALDDEDADIRIAAAAGIAAAPKGGTDATAEKLAAALAKSYPEMFDPQTARLDGPETVYWSALARTGKPAVPVLLGLVKHKNLLVRVMALRTIGDIGADAKPAAEAVAKFFTDPIANVALEAAVTLTRLGEKSDDVSGLLKAAFASNNPGVAAAAIEAVARMGETGKPFVPEALKQLESQQPEARYTAVMFVGLMDPAEAAKQVPALAKLAADPEPLIRQQVGIVLERLGPAASGAAAAVGQALLKENEDSIRNQFVDALIAMGPGAKPAAAQLLPVIADPAASFTMRARVIAAVAVADPDSKEVASALVKAAEDTDPNIRVAAAAALGQLNPLPDDARMVLVKMMKSDAKIPPRTAAVRGLAAAGPRAKAAKADLEAVAAGKMPGLALWAKVALAALDGNVTKAASTVREGLTDRSSDVRTTAAEALLLIGPKASDVPALVKLTRDTGTARPAAEALGRIGPKAKEAVPRLIVLLDNRDSEVRQAAVEALGRIGPAAAPAATKLRELVQSDPAAAPAARKALDRLGLKGAEMKE